MEFLNLELDLLRTFVISVEACSFARAADRVGRTPSAVSLQIDRLEELCGNQLFRREGRRFLLTPAGEKLLVYARRLLALNDEAVGALQFARHTEIVQLGIPEDIASGCLPGALKRFAAEHPNAHVTVRIGRSVKLLNSVERGDLDLAVVYGNHDSRGGVHAVDVPIGWIGSSQQQGCKTGDPVPLVLFAPPCCFRTAALEALDRVARKWNIVFESPNLVGQWAAVKAGLGISVRLLTSVPSDLVALRPENGLPALGAVPVALHAAHQLSAGARAFQRLLLEILPELTQPQTSSASLSSLGLN